MTIEIRVLQPGDGGVLATAPPRQVFDYDVDEEAARAFLADPRNHLVVAIDDGVVVGFVSAIHYWHPDKPVPELWIDEVGVAATHRRRGIGAAMLGAMLDVARELGCEQAWVLTDRGNTAAMRLYASAGGLEEAEETVMFTFSLRNQHAADD